MQINQIKIWKLLFMLLLMVACSENDDGDTPNHNEGAATEENRMSFVSEIVPHAGTTNETEEQNKWGKLSDRRVAVEIDGYVKLYTVNRKGELTSEEPFFWNGSKGVNVYAWYPYKKGQKIENIVVKADQSISTNYWASDYMEVIPKEVTVGNPELTFEHMTAQVIGQLEIKGEGGSQAAHARLAQITLHQLSGVEQGNSVRMSSNHLALVAPQTIPAGTDFIGIRLMDGRNYTCSIEKELLLQRGNAYIIQLSLTDNGLESISIMPGEWDGNEEFISANIKETVPDSEGDNWEGNEEDINGEGSETDPEGEGDNWNGGEENVNGEGSETDPEGEGNNWNGNEENVNGESSETDPEGEGNNWNGGEENVNGETNNTETEGKGEWNGQGEENVNGETNNTETEGEGEWNGQGEENVNGETNNTETEGEGEWNGQGEENVNGETNNTETEGEGEWNGGEENVNGETNNTETEGEGEWNGGEENVNGETNNTETGGEGEWNGEEGNVNGETNNTETGGEGEWNGGEENVNGETNNTETGGEGEWNEAGGSSEMEGETNNTETGGEGGTWNGNEEIITGTIGSTASQQTAKTSFSKLITHSLKKLFGNHNNETKSKEIKITNK